MTFAVPHVHDVAVHSTDRLFADDCIIYRPIRNNHDTILLQNDLNKIAEWEEFMWQMQFNIVKCFISRVGRPKHKLLGYICTLYTIKIYLKQILLNIYESLLHRIYNGISILII